MIELFLNILNRGLSASWLVPAVVLLRVLLKKAPKKTRIFLWLLVGLRLVLPFSLQSVLSLIPSAETVSPQILYEAEPTINTGFAALNNAVNPVITESFAPKMYNTVNPLQIGLLLASIVWLAGVGIMLVYAAVSTIKLQKCVQYAEWREAGVYESEKLSMPFVMGIFRPKILLPAGIAGTDRAYVLSHERAHIQHRDNVIKPVGFLLLAVHWFNPFLWLAYILLCRDIELACDEQVIKTLEPSERADYSETLLRFNTPYRTAAACPVAFGETGVKTRIKSILRYKKPGRWIVPATVILCAAAAVCFLTDPVEKGKKTFPWEHSYMVKSVIYQNPRLDMAVIPGVNASQYAITEDMTLLIRSGYMDYWSSVGWSSVGKFEEFELAKDNFDDYFRIDSSTGWEKGQKASSIRKDNEKVWRLTDGDILYYLLLQKDGEVFLACGYYDLEAQTDSASDDSSINWLLCLEQDYHKDTGMIMCYGNNSIPMVGCDISKPLRSIKKTLYILEADLVHDKDSRFLAFCDGREQYFLYALYDAETLDLICGYTTSWEELTRENIEAGKDYIVLAKHDPAYSTNDVDVWGFIAHVPLTRVYRFDQSSITLYEDGAFVFTFSLISDYIGMGHYTEENGRIKLFCNDNDFVYEFDRVDDMLIFDAEESSENLWYSGLTDGCVFK